MSTSTKVPVATVVSLSNVASHLGWTKAQARRALQEASATLITNGASGVIEYAVLEELQLLFPGKFLAGEARSQVQEEGNWTIRTPGGKERIGFPSEWRSTGRKRGR